jgi:hypothetical protein
LKEIANRFDRVVAKFFGQGEARIVGSDYRRRGDPFIWKGTGNAGGYDGDFN